MTEADWLGTSDPAPLLRFVAYRLTDRPQLLFMAGCCRRVWDLLTDPRFRRVVELAEDVADGRATEEALTAASEEAPRPGRPILRTLVLEGGRFVQTSNPSGSSDPLPAWHWHAYHAVAVIAPRR